mgnify:CR=1 FL=1
MAYGPRSKFLARVQDQPNLNDSRLAIKLPRMSFEITNVSYDPSRQLPKVNNYAKAVAGGSVLSRQKIYAGSPYIMSFQLSIYAKNQDDALQLVEQIIPYFNPQYTLSVKPFDDCQALTAASVLGPNFPIASTPNFSWSFLTSSPVEPIFNNIAKVFFLYIFILCPFADLFSYR